MLITRIVLKSIINYLSVFQDKETAQSHCQLITFFDKQFPANLRELCYQVPIVYYSGDISLLANCCGVLVVDSPNYYVQKVVRILNEGHVLLGMTLPSKSINKLIYLYDIIYCNDINEVQNSKSKLAFSLNIQMSVEEQLQLVSVLIKKLYVLEGYPSKLSFDFISNCADNSQVVYALPTNIFIKSGLLPNILIQNGVDSLMLYEK